jgi:hypothetical protein
MRTHFDNTGFTPPNNHPLGRETRTTALAELLAIVALAVSTIVVATVLSAGIANANVAEAVIDHEAGLFAVALLLGLIFVGVSGFSMLPGSRPNRR